MLSTLARGRGAALYLLLGALTVGPALWGGERFFYRDVSRQYAPVTAQVNRSLARLELPTWNASTQAGVPLLANPHVGALSVHALLFRLLPFDLAYAWTVALALALLGWGMQQLLEPEVGVSPALLAALTLMGCGVTLSATSYAPMLVAIACVPHVARALTTSHHRLSLTATAWLVVQWLSGDPALVLVSLGLALALSPTRGTLLRSTSSTALGAVLAAFQLLPATSLLTDSARSTADVTQRLAWSFHPARTLEWLVRLPFGQLLAPPYFEAWSLAAGPDAQPFFLEHGWGVVAAALLVPALSTAGPLRRAGLALVLGGFAVTLGKWLPGGAVLWSLPPLSFLRFPERFGVVVSFGAALLVAHGALALLRPPSPARRAAGALTLGLAALVASVLTASPQQEALRWTGALLLVAGVGLAAPGRPRGWLGVLLLVGAVDWARARTADRLVLEPLDAAAPPIIVALQGDGRVYRDNAAFNAGPPVRGAEAFRAELRRNEETLASALPGLFGVDELGGYSPVSLRWWRPVVHDFAQRPDVLLRMFDVCYLVTAEGRAWPSRFGFERELDLGGGAWLLRYRGCGARAWLVDTLTPVPSHEAALAAMRAPDFDPRFTAVVEGTLEEVTGLERADVTVQRKESSLIEVTTPPSSRARLLVVSETWAPGWLAQVELEPSAVLRVDGTLLGVALPAGATRVRLHYEEPWLLLGSSLSALGLLAVVLVLAHRRPPRGQAP